MKKLISVILSAAMGIGICASAAEITYNPQDNSIGIRGEEYGRQSILILEEGQSLSDITVENPPVYYRSFEADGSFDYTVPLGDNIASGYYNVYIGSDNTPYEVFVVNTEIADSFVKNVLDAQTSSGAFEEKLLNCKTELGINPDKIKDYSEPLAKLLYAKKPFGSFEAFDEAYKINEIYAKIITSSDAVSVMRSYEKDLGIKLSDDYDTLDDDSKKMMTALIQSADYVQNDFKGIYRRAYLQALFCGADYYTELKEITQQHHEELGIDMDEIKDCSDESEVYRRLMNYIDSIKDFDDIAVKTAKAAKEQKDKEDDESKSSGKKGSSGGGGGGGSVTVRPSEPDVVPVPPVNPSPETIRPENQISFDDLDGYGWALNAIASLKAKGIINGVSSNSFNPGANVTRAEFSKMTALLMGLDGGNADFDDVAKDVWYYPYVASCASNGIVKGDGKSFYPENPITREDAAVIIWRMAETVKPGLAGVKSYADSELISDYALNAVVALGANEIITGDEKGFFNPKSNLTRAEAAVLLSRLSEFMSNR